MGKRKTLKYKPRGPWSDTWDLMLSEGWKWSRLEDGTAIYVNPSCANYSRDELMMYGEMTLSAVSRGIDYFDSLPGLQWYARNELGHSWDEDDGMDMDLPAESMLVESKVLSAKSVDREQYKVVANRKRDPNKRGHYKKRRMVDDEASRSSDDDEASDQGTDGWPTKRRRVAARGRCTKERVSDALTEKFNLIDEVVGTKPAVPLFEANLIVKGKRKPKPSAKVRRVDEGEDVRRGSTKRDRNKDRRHREDPSVLRPSANARRDGPDVVFAEPPRPELLERKRGMPPKEQRENVAVGMRVKVRFEGGRWYGAGVAKVFYQGRKVEVVYDADEAAEIVSWPDDDVVVDDSANGAHAVCARPKAAAFLPPRSAARLTHNLLGPARGGGGADGGGGARGSAIRSAGAYSAGVASVPKLVRPVPLRVPKNFRYIPPPREQVNVAKSSGSPSGGQGSSSRHPSEEGSSLARSILALMMKERAKS